MNLTIKRGSTPGLRDKTTVYLVVDSFSSINVRGEKRSIDNQMEYPVILSNDVDGNLVIICLEPVKIVNKFEDKKSEAGHG